MRSTNICGKAYIYLNEKYKHMWQSVYGSCLVCSGLAYEICSGGGPSTYVYCVVCYRVIVVPYVRSVGHVFAYLYTLDDDSEWPMDYETSLLAKLFPLMRSTNICSKVYIYLNEKYKHMWQSVYLP